MTTRIVTFINFYKIIEGISGIVAKNFFEETYQEVDRSMDDVVFIDFSPESLEKSLREFQHLTLTEQ